MTGFELLDRGIYLYSKWMKDAVSIRLPCSKRTAAKIYKCFRLDFFM